MTRPRLTSDELRYLLDVLWARNDKSGVPDLVTGKWVYPTEVESKLKRMLQARKPSKRKP